MRAYLCLGKFADNVCGSFRLNSVLCVNPVVFVNHACRYRRWLHHSCRIWTCLRAWVRVAACACVRACVRACVLFWQVCGHISALLVFVGRVFVCVLLFLSLFTVPPQLFSLDLWISELTKILSMSSMRLRIAATLTAESYTYKHIIICTSHIWSPRSSLKHCWRKKSTGTGESSSRSPCRCPALYQASLVGLRYLQKPKGVEICFNNSVVIVVNLLLRIRIIQSREGLES